MKLDVEVQFNGIVTVSVPDTLTPEQGRVLANKLAIAQILATDDNPDCGECLDAACEEFLEETDNTTDQQFDVAEIVSIGGVWSLGDKE